MLPDITSAVRLQEVDGRMAELTKEIAPCKPALEDILGEEVRMFCYPCGRYDSNVVRSLKTAGYWGARTVQMLVTGFEFDPFEIPTTTQIIPHPRSSYFKNVARSRRLDCSDGMARRAGFPEAIGRLL